MVGTLKIREGFCTKELLQRCRAEFPNTVQYPGAGGCRVVTNLWSRGTKGVRVSKSRRREGCINLIVLRGMGTLIEGLSQFVGALQGASQESKYPDFSCCLPVFSDQGFSVSKPNWNPKGTKSLSMDWERRLKSGSGGKQGISNTKAMSNPGHRCRSTRLSLAIFLFSHRPSSSLSSQPHLFSLCSSNCATLTLPDLDSSTFGKGNISLDHSSFSI